MNISLQKKQNNIYDYFSYDNIKKKYDTKFRVNN